MYIEQLYTNCLAQAAYYIESNGEAAIIDPLRDYDTYLEKAKERGTKIRYIIETHFHADFVSGHLDLAKKTGAPIIYGPTAKTGFDIKIASDGEIFPLGDIQIKVMHTPGHTPESSCFLVINEEGKEHALFTGDTLFVGDVGRPDLLDGIMTKEELAGMMYDSLQKIKQLPDEVIVYPGHGAGSACGKNIGKDTTSTIGQQKQFNYAMQPMTREAFIAEITAGIAPPPDYFFADAKMNKQGYSSMDEVVSNGLKKLNISSFDQQIKQGATILDTRLTDAFEKGFVKGAINIALNGQFAIWAATLIDIHTPIVLVTEPGQEEESVTRLARTGFDNMLGVLEGGYESWKNSGKNIDMVISVEPDELEMDAKHSNITILDVRRKGEYDDLHIKDAQFITLQELPQQLDKLNKETDYYIHCAGGYRSMIAASILKKKGFERVRNIYGGIARIKDEVKGLEFETNVKPATV